jgi:predicted phosphohydrolase
MRVSWGTDLHFDHLSGLEFDGFLNYLSEIKGEVLLLGGDISNGDRLNFHLGAIGKGSPVPVYFVLGNHDYYGSSIEETRSLAGGHSYNEDVWFLTNAGPFQLTDRTWLVGVGGWADGRAGKFIMGDLWLNDYESIEDLSGPYKRRRPLLKKLIEERKKAARDCRKGDVAKANDRLQKELRTMKKELAGPVSRLGDWHARRLTRQLKKVPAEAEHILVLTHVPPWRESSWHGGTVSDDNWAPHFTCIATGKVLKKFMEENPGRTMTVLCGHTHGAGEVNILPNLRCITQASCEDGSDEYGHPWISNSVEVP